MSDIKLSPRERRQAISVARKKLGSHWLEWSFFILRRSLAISLLILVFLAVIYIILKSGAVKVPLAGDFLYKEPSPTRQVPVNLNDSIFSNQAVENINDEIKITITESQLTAMVAAAASGSNSQVSGAQAVITANYIELFGEMTAPVKAKITARLRPKVAGNVLDYDLQDIKIGNLPLPSSVVDAPVRSLLKSGFDEVNSYLKQNMDISSIELAEGRLIITGRPKP